ncbi:MAG: serine O-acetyltransferase, partial [Gammaproteobacteria bacterium]|nr:serine O-acetyltransferase [Gammaproteobacteria bacterium]
MSSILASPAIGLEFDPVWETIRSEVAVEVEAEPALASYMHASVLNHKRLEDALGFILAAKLDSPMLASMQVRELFHEAMQECPEISRAARADLRAVRERDPAAKHLSRPFLFFKGFHSLQTHRTANWLWRQGREALALYMQSRCSEVFDVDIHPAARIGQGIMIDHATGVVVGETAVIEDNVSMLHAVTLGGTG